MDSSPSTKSSTEPSSWSLLPVLDTRQGPWHTSPPTISALLPSPSPSKKEGSVTSEAIAPQLSEQMKRPTLTTFCVGALVGARVGCTGAGVGATGAGVGATGAGVGGTGAGVGATGEGVTTTGAIVGDP